MNNFFSHFNLYKNLLSKVLVGCIGGLGLIFFFQNCSGLKPESIRKNPNVAPLGAGIKEPLVAPNTLKNKMIGGIEVPGYEAGTWIHAFVDDQCVLNRKDIIQNSPFYFLDIPLKKYYPFDQNVGKFNLSLISFQLESFMSKTDFDISLALDACSAGSYLTSSAPMNISFNPPDTSAGFVDTWTQMNLSENVLQMLLSINKSTKVNVGISGTGFKTDLNPPLPVSANSVGLGSGKRDSLGTVLASMIATPKSGIAFRGVADGVAQLIPLTMPEGYTLPGLVFWIIKQAVNRGSEVLVMPLWAASTDYCDPLIGQAMFYAIERGTTIVVPAGNTVGGESQGSEFTGPRDFNLFQASKTSQVSCWARYFRGVINVASSTNNLQATEISSTSNYGHEGVELIAPGTNVTGMNDASLGVLASGTEVSAALAAGAVSHIISFYKSKGWFYSPWLVEDTLMNGSRTANNLPEIGTTVRNRKVLDFSALKDFLTVLNEGTEADSRNQVTDNPESGQSINLSSLAPGELPLKLDVYSKTSFVSVKDRSQFQAVFYYTSGAVKVVTDEVVWTSNNPNDFPVDSHGVVKPSRAGSFVITARDLSTGLSSSYSAEAVVGDIVSGTTSKLVRLELRDTHSPFEPMEGGYKMNALRLYPEVYAIYEDGRSRLVSDNTVYTVMLDNKVLGDSFIRMFPHIYALSSFTFFRGGRVHDLVLFYRGHQERIKLLAPTYDWVGWRWAINNERLSLVKERPNDNSISLYIAVFWKNFSFKFPTCFFKGSEITCPRNEDDLSPMGTGDCDRYICGHLLSSTIPNYGSFPPAPGDYKVHQEYKFWGNGSGDVKTASVDVKLVSVPKEKYFKEVHLTISNSKEIFLKNSPRQIAPMCGNINAQLNERNVQFGIDDLFGFRGYDSGSVLSMTASQSPYNNFVGDQNRHRILFKNAANNFNVNFTLTDLNLSTNINELSWLGNDPLDSTFDYAETTFGGLGLVTPRVLPELPASPPIDSRCASQAQANGSHGGNGSRVDPFVFCNLGEISLFVSSTTVAQMRTTHVALGNNIDFTGWIGSGINMKGVMSFDGRNYRVKNASMLDTENDLVIFSGIESASSFVFIDNDLKGRKVQLLEARIISDVYAYDNKLEGREVYGVTETNRYCQRVFTRNILRYLNQGYGICGALATAFESFSKDTVNYIGVPGNGIFLGVAGVGIASGSASVIVGGSQIGGVADTFCYKCYSDVDISTSNYVRVGGILSNLATSGTIEVGESNARILVAGTGYAGGIAGSVGVIRADSIPDLSGGSFLLGKFGHTNLVRSKFTGSISGTGYIGGIFGEDTSQVDLYITNTLVSGTVAGDGVKGSLVGKASGFCVASENPKLKGRGILINTTSVIPSVGNGRAGAAIKDYDPY